MESALYFLPGWLCLRFATHDKARNPKDLSLIKFGNQRALLSVEFSWNLAFMMEGNVNCEYDAFEVLPDGTLIWKATVVGHEDAIKKLQQLAKHNRNEFRLMHVPSKTVIATINAKAE